MKNKYFREILAKEIGELDNDDWGEINTYLLRFNNLQNILHSLYKAFSEVKLELEDNFLLIECLSGNKDKTFAYSPSDLNNNNTIIKYDLTKSLFLQTDKTKLYLTRTLFYHVDVYHVKM